MGIRYLWLNYIFGGTFFFAFVCVTIAPLNRCEAMFTKLDEYVQTLRVTIFSFYSNII